MTLIVTNENLRKTVDDRFLKEDKIGDRAKVARAAQKLLDSGLGLPGKVVARLG